MRAVAEQDELPTETKEKLANLVRNVIQPAGIEGLLREKVRAIRLEWRDYLNNSGEVLNELVKRGLVVQPDLKLTPEYLKLRKSEGGVLSGEHPDIEQLHRDAWSRLSEAQLKARPDQVIRLTPENNIFPYDDGTKLMKHSDVAKTARVESADKAASALLCSHAVADRLKGTRVGDVVVGADYQGVFYTAKSFRIVHLSDIFRAQLLDQLPANIGGTILGEVSFLTDTQDIFREGAQVIVTNIPSVGKPGKVHSTSLYHIPVVSRMNGDYKSVMVPPEAIALSYDFHWRGTSEKETFWPIKYSRNGRRGDEEESSVTSVFGAIRTREEARRQLEGGHPPWREFVVLPMFPEIPFNAMRDFRRLYGSKTSAGATGGVILEELVRSIRGGIEREELMRKTLTARLVDFEIALHNLVAFAQYDLTPQKPKLTYAALA